MSIKKGNSLFQKREKNLLNGAFMYILNIYDNNQTIEIENEISC